MLVLHAYEGPFSGMRQVRFFNDPFTNFFPKTAINCA